MRTLRQSKLSDVLKVTQIISDQIMNQDKQKWRNGDQCGAYDGMEVKLAGRTWLLTRCGGCGRERAELAPAQGSWTEKGNQGEERCGGLGDRRSKL